MRRAVLIPLATFLVILGGLALVVLRHPEPIPEASKTPVRAPMEGTGDGRYVSFTADSMATTIRATVPAGPEAEAQADAVFDTFRDVDREMSEWREGSPLTAVNRAAGGEAVQVPRELYDLIRRGIEIGDLTHGAFDITWAALWGLWDFRAEDPRVPSDEEIAERAGLVDYRRIELDPERHTVRLPEKGMALGLGGIAKGYALGRAAAVLRGWPDGGVESFLLVAGGQVLAVGGKRGDAGEGPWRVGVRDPRGGPGDLFALLALTGGSLSTSGDYERYFIADGVRYHHVLDPRTGRPARGVRSATVVCQDPVLADALSTALMVLGVDRALGLVGRLDGVEAVLVDGEGAVHESEGLRGRLEILHPPRADGTP